MAVLISTVQFPVKDYQLTLDILREQRQGIGVEVKPSDGSGPQHHTADGEDAAATAEVRHVFVLEVVEGCGHGVDHTGCYMRSGGILL